MPLKNYNTSNSSGFENHKRHGHSVGLSFEDSEKTVKSMDSGLVDPPNSFPAFTPPGRSWEEPGLLSSQNNSSHRHNRPFSVLSYSSMLSNPVSPSPTNKIPSLANHTMGLMNRASNLSGIPTTKRSSRWTVVVIPPLLLPHSPPPPHVSGFAHGYGASGRYDSGLLLPLQPTVEFFFFFFFFFNHSFFFRFLLWLILIITLCL
ncbi:hypothetical protein BY996DRAFT_7067028 [Phakopsora pachyrhizi]|nr:hypothetical protein BY996DRAFT_7067028 [Phakopsora pachyrhizi]